MASTMSQLDANQVIKKVYDEGTTSLSIVQTYVDTTVLVNASAANADFTTSEINILPYKVVGLMANWVGFNSGTATLQFQGSMDNSIWENVGSPYTIAATPTSQHSFALVDEPYKYVRLVFAHGSNSAGTITIKYVMRA